MRHRLLGGLAPAAFLKRHWQRMPLLVRGAASAMQPLLARDVLFALACRDDVESRLVRRVGSRWEVAHGPFNARTLRAGQRGLWTLLVQGVDLHVPEARTLLERFRFVPDARLDDLMVSYAPPGGGVGPHFDSYDVFLLQGPGRRRWRVARPGDATLVADAPLRLLANFRAEGEAVLAPGDMLYLPPAWGHDGVAETECMTYSVGFRAPTWQEVASAFFERLAEQLQMDGRYSDPGLAPAAHPARIPPRLVERYLAALKRQRITRREVEAFAGSWLSEPKAQVVFSAPRPALGAAAFRKRAARRALVLEPRTRMLYADLRVYINGEELAPSRRARGILRRLADTRCIAPGTALDAEALAILYQWYRGGYIRFATTADPCKPTARST